MSKEKSRVTATILGGAIGDSLGAAVEFLSAADIKARYGGAGPQDILPAYGQQAPITDDTQMTLWSMEGLMRWRLASKESDANYFDFIRGAYLRWLRTQGRRLNADQVTLSDPSGWLFQVENLHSQRAPGNTCLGALIEGHALDSKGCGGVMRAAPFGLAQLEDPFQSGSESAALTHGHPSAYLPAGMLAEIISLLVKDSSLPEAIETAKAKLITYRGHQETLEKVEAAQTLSQKIDTISFEQIEQVGGGWMGHEALAIALLVALVEADPKEALLKSINHSGDSDSTGAISGNLLGAMHGLRRLPSGWLRQIEIRKEMIKLSEDFYQLFWENKLDFSYPTSP
jgi:ADP-ribosylglycohydrolase